MVKCLAFGLDRAGLILHASSLTSSSQWNLQQAINSRQKLAVRWLLLGPTSARMIAVRMISGWTTPDDRRRWAPPTSKVVAGKRWRRRWMPPPPGCPWRRSRCWLNAQAGAFAANRKLRSTRQTRFLVHFHRQSRPVITTRPSQSLNQRLQQSFVLYLTRHDRKFML